MRGLFFYTPSMISSEISKVDNIGTIETIWRDLEGRADNRFFLSWYWISAWYDSFSPNVKLLKVLNDGKVISLGLICENVKKRHWVILSKQIFLNETGVPDQDQQWIEYNGFLVDREYTNIGKKEAIEALMSGETWDEFVIGVITEDEAELYRKLSNLKVHVLWESISHGIDLQKIKASGKDYLQTLSKNARYQINRSKRAYGDIQIEHAATLEQALSFLEQIAPLHIKRWGSGFQESGFANPSFVEFHKNLITRAWNDGCIDIIRLSVKGRAFAYFYNFLYKNRVYFYLSAMDFEDDSKYKPGLMGHALCIQEYLDRGFIYYDFMGGGESYKDRLAEVTGKLCRMALQRPKLKLKVESIARKLKHKISKRK